MSEIKKKWILVNIITEAMKIALTLGALTILWLLCGIAEGTAPFVISAIAIIGVCYICRDCYDAAEKLEDILDDIERKMKKEKHRAIKPIQQNTEEETTGLTQIRIEA